MSNDLGGEDVGRDIDAEQLPFSALQTGVAVAGNSRRYHGRVRRKPTKFRDFEMDKIGYQKEEEKWAIKDSFSCLILQINKSTFYYMLLRIWKLKLVFQIDYPPSKKTWIYSKLFG